MYTNLILTMASFHTFKKKTLQYVEYKTQHREGLSKTSFKETIKSFFLQFMVLMPFKVKAPKTVAVLSNDLDLKTLKNKWILLTVSYLV